MAVDGEAAEDKRRLLGMRAPMRQPGCSTLPLPVTPLRRGGAVTTASSTKSIPRSGRVRLQPGHSALDWQALSQSHGSRGTFIHGLDASSKWWDYFMVLQHPASVKQLQMGVPTYRIQPPLRVDKMVLESTKENDWCVLKGRVYCITDYLDFHPGGVQILVKNCRGKDATRLFEKYHRWVNLEQVLACCVVGVYVS
ncbi:Irc21p Ecym_7251 [Eremothecium cymbalariae DBVPG|uniref:Cytochrome b5 heme-binding domain-containing protein n=1 Tax=Eremothecium cymbalariae (strain CBS 270.75 / DBVPG 7215 / KCTC 17166 / NRRL Y-17582) TaxID=931890 RepID=G8JW80_ERECY|nr:hypothetical protein Ecym_7251 [Eremothecium cymbalariae DBVPG\